MALCTEEYLPTTTPCHVSSAHLTNKKHLTASLSVKPSPVHPHPIIRLDIHSQNPHLSCLDPLVLYLPQFHQLLLTKVTLLLHWHFLVFARMSFEVHVGIIRVIGRR